MPSQLAQVNIARMRGTTSAEVMAGLVARIDEMNRLADQSKGFVWRLPGNEATPQALGVFADYFVPFDPGRIFYNLSVWETVEDLREYVFRSAHAAMLRHKHEWIEHWDRAQLALWWIPSGQFPNVAESAERLRSIQEKGPTEFAFNFQELFEAIDHRHLDDTEVGEASREGAKEAKGFREGP